MKEVEKRERSESERSREENAAAKSKPTAEDEGIVDGPVVKV